MRPSIHYILLTLLFFLSCRKLSEVDPPPTKQEAEKVYAKDVSAISVLTGVYSGMSQSGFTGGPFGLSMIAGLSADELKGYQITGSITTPAYQNALSIAFFATPNFWNDIYVALYGANSAIAGITASATLTPSVKQQLLGEARFVRAFLFFYLTNLYGDVPLVISTDYKTNISLPRTPQEQVYQQIIKDLEEAKELLTDNYLNADMKTATDERIRPNKWAANALLARVYLYHADYAKAEQAATTVISNSLYDTVPVSEVFLKNNKEAIWQLQPIKENTNTADAVAFILTMLPGADQPASLSDQLLSAFEIHDKRRENWVGSIELEDITFYYPYKYKVREQSALITEYTTVLRLGEQYLIRAEARVQQNNISGAQDDINVLRTRAGLPDTKAVSKTSLLTAIEHERQVELFTEWGHRWLDLKRTNRVNEVMNEVTPLKGGVWAPSKSLYPIPLSDIVANNNLKQNPGYE